MGTDVTVLGPAAPAFSGVVDVVRSIFEEEDRRFSRFRPDSELARANAAAGTWTEVSRPFAEVVSLAIAAWRHTDGRFDPTVLDAVVAAGYDRDFDELVSGARGVLRPPRPCGRAGEVRLRGRWLRLPAGVGLDLGGIAKGWTVDRAAGAAVGGRLAWALVNAGGDLRLAGDRPAEGLVVSVDDPELAGADVGRIELRTGALATSSVTRRAWGAGLHHLIDPSTGRPADVSVLQATVWAATCVEAEIAAKDALLEGEPALERRAALLVLRDGRVMTNLATPGVAA
jgi:thiamine biosynthesis lipoprotein